MADKTELGHQMVVNVERHIFDLEGVRVIIRSPLSQLLANSYTYQRGLGDQDCLRDLDRRMNACLPGIEYAVIDGYGQASHHPSKKLKGVRESYLR